MRLTTLTLSLALFTLVGCDSKEEESDDGWGSEEFTDDGTADADEGAVDDGGRMDSTNDGWTRAGR